ncbi:SDR family NAD(P)-dependent oxidoreductase [Flagellimonas marina]|uniref:SDR family NAD(P)-dependent oxidoreductase n=1 Tax=Flagellimonas marina TaxID=1775168 RepID=A0ABV8PIH9_9FLAO
MIGKNVIVSGGTSGLGLATVNSFLEEGANVVVAARSREKFEENLGKEHSKLHFVQTDFNNMQSVNSLYEWIEKKFTTLDIAINNVGHGTIKPMTEFSEADFDYALNVNLKSLWLSLKHQIRLMKGETSKQKHIINVSSINGLGGAEYLSLYAAAKAGVISLTKSAALENAKSNIAINVIVPGPFATPMLENVFNIQAGGDMEKQNAISEQYKGMIPAGRFGRPDELAEAIVWLCQGKSTYLSGHSLIIDGGLTSRFR